MATSTKHPRAISRNLYDEVTARILTQLEAGTPPWVKEWKSIGRDQMTLRDAAVAALRSATVERRQKWP